jgi:hypothetical protein
MCNPLLFNCSAAYYPLLIDSAIERFGDDVHLSKEAQQLLYERGNKHKADFEKLLKPENQKEFDKLSKALHDRLKVALRNSRSKDAAGQLYNPPRIDRDALQQALDATPWVPKRRAPTLKRR